MFKLVTNRVVKNWPATIKLAADNGDTETHNITLDIEILPTDEFARYSKRGDEAFFKKAIKGWSGVADEHGEPLPFNADTVTAASRHPSFTAAALTAYLDAAQGKAATKN
uniref:hypothetical protein n=1 Tax=Thaumasiovibrio occultus TaxID=1891184 RepID=UPI000B35B2F5|nr:hypothetical protein [Thaumasiovibrio occultus]